MGEAKTLFPPWHLQHWRQVDDSVRGGSSVSYLTPADARSDLGDATLSAEKGSGKSSGTEPQMVEFSGTLDIMTLGGAGFASQKYTYIPPLALPSKQYSGIRIQVLPDLDDEDGTATAKPRYFTCTVATTPSRKLPNGRTASRVMWEANFRAPRSGTTDDPVAISLPFSSFTATYRGRPVPLHEVARLEEEEDSGDDYGNEKRRDAARVEEESGASETNSKAVDEATGRFHTEHIFELGLMCRSGFGRQGGRFSLRIAGIEAMERQQQDDAAAAPNTGTGSLLSRLFCFL